MTVPEEHDCLCEPAPRCPYCGDTQSDFWEVSGEDGDCECGNCTRTFRWSRYVDVTYTTEPIVGPHKLHPSDVVLDAQDNPLEKS